MERMIYVVQNTPENEELLEMINSDDATDEEIVDDLELMGVPKYSEDELTDDQIDELYDDIEDGMVLFWDGEMLEG